MENVHSCHPFCNCQSTSYICSIRGYSVRCNETANEGVRIEMKIQVFSIEKRMFSSI